MSVVLSNREGALLATQNNEVAKKPENDKRIFVVHRHLSSILHYDLRIEINGILKNWALPSGPSMNCGDRRLAIMTGDKPISYANIKIFEPNTDEVIENWDKGYIVPHSIYSSGCSDKDIMKQLEDGRLRFTLRGKKLRGVFSLVRLNDYDSAKWLLIKGNDRYAVNYAYNCENYIGRRSAINRRLKKES
jgi:bifunctional non-homologous end joining protein LigD